MIANYGYEDGAGFFYIAIDTDKCAECDEKGCIDACPQGVYAMEEDDWGDDVVVVVADKTSKLQDLCAECKRDTADKSQLPCFAACDSNALTHTW